MDKISKSTTIEVKTGCGKIFITIAEDDTVVIKKGSKWADDTCDVDAWFGTLIDLINWAVEANRKTLKQLAESFQGHACKRRMLGRGAKSCSGGIARALIEHFDLKEGK